MSAIVGLGLATPWGLGVDAAVSGFRDGRSALVVNDRWPTAGFVRGDAGLVGGFKPRKQLPDRKAVKLMSLEAQLMVYAAVEAAGTDAPARFGVPAKRLGAFAAAGYEVSSLDDTEEMLAQSMVDGRLDLARLFGPGRDACNPLAPLKILPNMGLYHAVAALGAQGPQLALGSSPAAGLAALGEAVEAVRYGEADAALALGGDACVEVFRSHLLAEAGVLATLAPAEGAAALVIGREGGVRVLAWAVGQETVTGPEPRGDYGAVANGAGRREVVADVVDRGGLPDFVLGDIWDRPERDEVEYEALRAVLGDVPVQATRPLVGWMGAAHGLADVVLAAALVQRGHARRVLVTASGLAGDVGAVLVGRAS